MTGALTWDRFREDVARLAEVPLEQVTKEARAVEDLGLDSLALAELAAILIDEYGNARLSETLEDRKWEGVTLRALYGECAEQTERAR